MRRKIIRAIAYAYQEKNLKKLVEVASFFTFLGFFVEPQYFIDDFYV